jgi:hypothetical protein
MGPRIRTIVLAVAMATPLLADDTRDPAGTDVVVNLYEYARVSDQVLEDAVNYADALFRQSGVAVSWVKQSRAADQKGRDGSGHGRHTTLALRILPSEMIPRWANHRHHLGYSINPTDGRFGRIAAVYYERIRKTADQFGAKASQVLGHAMAHELGHLLLGPNSHHYGSVMCPRIKRHQAILISQESLSFTRKEAARMREQIQNRMTADQLESEE